MWTASLALFVVTLGFGVVVPLMPAIAQGAGEGASQFSALFVAYSAARITCQVPGGVWVDRAGALSVLRIALALYALSLGGLLVPGGLVWFTAVRTVEGAATGLAFPATLALAAAAGPPDAIGRRIGLVTGVGTSGFLVGPVMGGALAGSGPQLPLTVALAAAVAMLVFLLVVTAPATAERAARTVRGEVAALARMSARPDFIGLVLPLGFNKLVFSGMQALLPLWGADVLGLGVRGVTGLFALSGVVFAVVQPLAGALADRLDPRAVIVACAVPMMIAIGFLGEAPGGASFAALFGGYILLSSVIFAATLKHAGRAYGEVGGAYGGVFGVVQTLTDLMTLVGPVLSLVLYQTRPGQLFPVVAAIGVPFQIGFVLLTRLRRPA